jgi:hypothetical protein
VQVWSLSRTLCHFQVTIPRCVRWQLTLATWLYTVVLRILSLSTVKAIASNHIEMRISGCFTQVHNKTNIGSKPISHNPYRYIHIYIYYNIYLYKIYLYVYIINIYIYRLDILESFNHLRQRPAGIGIEALSWKRSALAPSLPWNCTRARASEPSQG